MFCINYLTELRFTNIYKAICLSSIVWLSACSQTSNEPEQKQQGSGLEAITLYKTAIIALNEDDLETAEALFINMTKIEPNMAGPWANLAVIELRQDNNTKAKEYLAVALEKNPKMPQALNLSGTIALKEGSIKAAQRFYQQAISHKADYALAHYNLALLNDIYLQDIATAVTHYKLYLANIKGKDKETTNWLESLEATLARSDDE